MSDAVPVSIWPSTSFVPNDVPGWTFAGSDAHDAFDVGSCASMYCEAA